MRRYIIGEPDPLQAFAGAATSLGLSRAKMFPAEPGKPYQEAWTDPHQRVVVHAVSETVLELAYMFAEGDATGLALAISGFTGKLRLVNQETLLGFAAIDILLGILFIEAYRRTKNSDHPGETAARIFQGEK